MRRFGLKDHAPRDGRARRETVPGAKRPLLAAAGAALLVAGVACSSANSGYGAKNAPPAAAATQIAAAQAATSPLSTLGVIGATPAVTVGAPAAAASPATATAVPPSATPAVPQAVGIAGFAFAPATLHVPVGGAVTWTNNDAVTHTVTPDAGGIEAHELAPGAGFTQSFSSPGTYGYHCAIHPFMKGSIVVG